MIRAEALNPRSESKPRYSTRKRLGLPSQTDPYTDGRSEQGFID